MIIAAAITYYIPSTDKEVVMCGVRHGDIFYQLSCLGFKPREGYIEIEQGFITHDHKFLNREQAYKYAKEIGQISEQLIIYRDNQTMKPELFSEDLW